MWSFFSNAVIKCKVTRVTAIYYSVNVGFPLAALAAFSAITAAAQSKLTYFFSGRNSRLTGVAGNVATKILAYPFARYSSPRNLRY